VLSEKDLSCEELLGTRCGLGNKQREKAKKKKIFEKSQSSHPAKSPAPTPRVVGIELYPILQREQKGTPHIALKHPFKGHNPRRILPRPVPRQRTTKAQRQKTAVLSDETASPIKGRPVKADDEEDTPTLTPSRGVSLRQSGEGLGDRVCGRKCGLCSRGWALGGMILWQARKEERNREARTGR